MDHLINKQKPIVCTYNGFGYKMVCSSILHGQAQDLKDMLPDFVNLTLSS